MLKNYYLLLLFVSLSSIFYAQQNPETKKIDSLLRLIKVCKVDTTKVNLYFELSYVYQNNDLKECKIINSKILNQYKAELASLKTQKDKYVFDGKELTLFMKNDKTADTMLLTENQAYFLKKDSFYYDLKMTNKTLPLKKVSDIETIAILEKINFQNEP